MTKPDDMPNWVWEFDATYDVPDAITQMEGIEDHSWHNDTSPSFGLYDDRGTFLRLWVEHPDPYRREFGPDQPRFGVFLHDDDDGGAVGETWQGEDLHEAIRAFMVMLPEYHAMARAKRGAA